MDNDFERFVQEIKGRIDISEFLGQYTSLRKSGSRFMGLCPLHGDKDPSFSVTPDNGLWHCFGCKKGGDIFQFVQEKENMTFWEACEFLAARYNVDLPARDGKKDTSPKRAIMDMHKIAEEFFSTFIRSPRAQLFRDYLRKRNITKEVVETFNVGASPDTWDSLLNVLRKKQYSDDLIFEAGLASRNDKGNTYDRFRNRLIIPIHDHLGRTVGFGGRVIGDGEPKYLNSPESSIFKKSGLLFALPKAKSSIKEQDFAIVMEGYTDVMRAHQNGITNAVASMGTALTSQQIRILSRLASTIYLAFDSDEAGIKAAVRSTQELIKAQVKARVVVFDKGMDPEDFIIKHGKDAFLERLNDAKEGIWFLIDQEIPAQLPSAQDSRIKILQNAIQQVSLIPFEDERIRIIDKIVPRLEISKELAREAYKNRKRAKILPFSADQGDLEIIGADERPDPAEFELMIYIVNYPTSRIFAREHLQPSEFKNFSYRKFIKKIFDIEFPITNENLHEITEINQNEDFMLLISELRNSLNIPYQRDESDFLGKLFDYKERSIKAQRKVLLRKCSEASRDNDDDLVQQTNTMVQQLSELMHKYQQTKTAESLEHKIMEYIAIFPNVRRTARKHLNPTDFKYYPYEKLTNLLFSDSFIFSDDNLLEIKEIKENLYCFALIQQLQLKYKDTYKYTPKEFEELVSTFKLAEINDDIRTKKVLLQKAVAKKDKAAIDRFEAVLEELKVQQEFYSNEFKIG